MSAALRLAPALLAALLAAGCDASHAASDDARHDGHDAPPAAAAAAHDAAGHRSLEAAGATDFSLYHAASTWRDQRGESRTLASLAGRVQVVAMLYTSCAYACPRIMLDLKRIEAELGPRLAGDVGFVVVSIDPERDSPERLAEFAEGSRLDPARWTLLTGDAGGVLELAVLLGVQYRETAPGEWVHSNVITVLDGEGEIVHRQLGLGTDPSETLAAIRAAAE